MGARDKTIEVLVEMCFDYRTELDTLKAAVRRLRSTDLSSHDWLAADAAVAELVREENHNG